MNVNSLNTAFSLKVKDVIYSGEMKVGENNILTLTFGSPEEVEGLIFIANSSETVTEFKNVRLPATSEDNAVSQLYRAAETLRTAEDFTNTPDGYELKNDDFSAVLDSQGNLKWLKVSQGEFYFK